MHVATSWSDPLLATQSADCAGYALSLLSVQHDDRHAFETFTALCPMPSRQLAIALGSLEPRQVHEAPSDSKAPFVFSQQVWAKLAMLPVHEQLEAGR